MRRRLVKGAMSAGKRLGLTKLIRALVARLPARFSGRFESRVYALHRTAGHATAHSPHATHFSRPFSSRISTCLPRYFGNIGIFWSG